MPRIVPDVIGQLYQRRLYRASRQIGISSITHQNQSLRLLSGTGGPGKLEYFIIIIFRRSYARPTFSKTG